MTQHIDEDKAVARLAGIMALKCGIHPTAAKQIRIAAALHDVGKLRICPGILNKPGKLTEQEFAVMKTHTTLGAETLKSLQGELGKMAYMTALYHHENWDGTGYFGRRADSLPLYVQIVSLCDVFVALVSNNRPYKAAWLPNDAVEYIESKAGSQFNPALAAVFVSLIRHDGGVPAIFGGAM